MHITPPNPEQITALYERATRAGDLIRRFIDGFKELARRIAPFLRAFVVRVNPGEAPTADPLGLAYRAAAGTRPRMTAQSRPAWASPYGPAPRRSR